MSLIESQLKEGLKREEVDGVELFYSVVKKSRKLISAFDNPRLLIFDYTNGVLFYINDTNKAPFKDTRPKPKNNEVAYIATSLVTLDGPILYIEFVVATEGKDMETRQWIFNCITEKNAAQWQETLNLYKKKKYNASKVTTDTLAFGLIQGLKKQKSKENILKPDQFDDQEEKIEEEKKKIQRNKENQRLKEIERKKQIAQSLQRSRQLQQIIIQKNIQENKSIRKSQQISGLKEQQRQQQSIQFNQSKIINQNKQISRQMGQSHLSLINSYMIKPQIVPEIDILSQNLTSQKAINPLNWNYIFYKNPTESTLAAFQTAALAQWKRVSMSSDQQKGIYQNGEWRIITATMFSKQATLLRKQFNNYHFIMQATGDKFVVKVPLCILIEHKGITALIKATLPQVRIKLKKQVLAHIKDLQRYTRVLNITIDTLYDMTQLFGSEQPILFVQDLVQYLPMHVEEEYAGCALRPQFMLDRVQQLLPGGEVRGSNKSDFKLMSTICAGVDAAAKQLAQALNKQEVGLVHAEQLKDMLHSYGVNCSYLPKIYAMVSNKHAKRCILSSMVAIVVKDHIHQNIIAAKRVGKDNCKLVEDMYKSLLEGGTSTSNLLWKNISVRFKKIYSIPYTSNDIIPGFFFNSLLRFIPGEYDFSKIDKSKEIFRDTNIISQGFVMRLLPKIRSYSKYLTQFSQKILGICKEKKKSNTAYRGLVQALRLQNKDLGQQWRINEIKPTIVQYLSYFVGPPTMDAAAKTLKVNIYEQLNAQPPTTFSLMITEHYLQWCNKRDQFDSFKEAIKRTEQLIVFWLDDDDLTHCKILQQLSQFHFLLGEGEESLAYAKEALSLTIRNCGTQSKNAGIKYYELAEREIKLGRKKEALDNFNKAKINIETLKENNYYELPIIYMRLGSLKLNSGDVEGCIEHEKAAMRLFDQVEKVGSNVVEMQRMKAYEILSRAYEIQGKTAELRDLALACAKKFNKSKEPIIFEQMVRICVAGSIFYHPQTKGKQFQQIVERIIKEEGQVAHSLQELMRMSDLGVVMEKFISRFDALERINAEAKTKKGLSADSKQFLLISKLVASVVSPDYVSGLITQRSME